MSSSSESDSSAWEADEGIPQLSDPFIQKYLDGREALIEQEKSTRSDAAFLQSLTPMAKEACAIVSRIRAEENKSVWMSKAQYDNSLEQALDNVHPGMMFTLAREKMEKTKVWQIVRKMPKGALLHAHFDAMVDTNWLIEQNLRTDGIAIKAQKPMDTAEARQNGSITFQFVEAFVQDHASIWASGYQPNYFVPLKEAADSFPDGGREGFKSWVKEKCTITDSESLQHHHGLRAVWRKFETTFPLIGSMLQYEPTLRAAIQYLLRELHEDGVKWVDLRLAFTFVYRRLGSEKPEVGYYEFFRVFGEELDKFKSTEEGKGFWGSSFIWTTLRWFDRKKIIESMKDCIDIKHDFPNLISGFDVVGQEDKGRTLADLTPELFWFRKRCLEEGLDIPFFFHAGETLGDGNETDQNLFDAILLGTRRIGHGFSLYKHPLLIEMVKEKKILVESCPISNEVLRLTSSILSHPLPALLARGVSTALSNDDPAILGYGKNGMTHDFWQALQGWENLGLQGLGSLAENSVRFAAYTPGQSTKEWNKDVREGVFGQGIRAERMREWTAEWNKFCEWVVLEFAGDYGSDKE